SDEKLEEPNDPDALMENTYRHKDTKHSQKSVDSHVFTPKEELEVFEKVSETTDVDRGSSSRYRPEYTKVVTDIDRTGAFNGSQEISWTLLVVIIGILVPLAVVLTVVLACVLLKRLNKRSKKRNHHQHIRDYELMPIRN